MEAPQQDRKGEKVIEGANGANTEHEVANDADIPALRGTHETGVHVVGRDGDLGQVIEEVVEQDLQGEHRQEGQEQDSTGHAEHIAKVGTGAHQEILHHIGKSFAALDDATVQDGESALAQENVRGILGHVHTI